MSKTITIQQQQQKSKIVNLKPQKVLETETNNSESDNEDTDAYYGNIIGQFKTVIMDQYKEIDEKSHKLKVIEKAMTIKNDETKKEIKDKEIKLKLLEQEMQYMKDKEISRGGNKTNARKIVQELHDINSKRRDRNISDVQLDAEAREYLKKFE
jgi:hypothetical protein